MFPLLGAGLQFFDKSLAGKIILVTEDDSDGSFVLHHLISQFIKDGLKVCLVGVLQSFQHYSCVQMKLGNNLNSLQSNGKFGFVNCFELLYEKEANGSTLKELFFTIESEIENLTNEDKTAPFLLVVDDVSLFLSLGADLRLVASFFRNCKSLVKDNTKANGCMAVGVHKGEQLCEDEEKTNLSTYLSHLSDVLVEVESLETGYFKDVHGQIQITHFDRHQPGKAICMHFKVEERNVHLFAPGTSSATL